MKVKDTIIQDTYNFEMELDNDNNYLLTLGDQILILTKAEWLQLHFKVITTMQYLEEIKEQENK